MTKHAGIPLIDDLAEEIVDRIPGADRCQGRIGNWRHMRRMELVDNERVGSGAALMDQLPGRPLRAISVVRPRRLDKDDPAA